LTLDQSTLIALWTAQTHAPKAFDYVAYLNIYSPLPECGKSRLLEVLEAIVRRPWLTGRVTAAVLSRKVDAEHPVLLLDESDAAFGGDKEYAEALRGLLNTGFHISGKSSCCVGQGANLTYRDFSTFGPKAIAGIGQRLPSTVISRSIPIALKRRTKDEIVAKWRRRDAWAEADGIRDSLQNAMGAMTEALGGARPAPPDGLSDRAEDVLEALFVIADRAAGDWPRRARAAAVALMGYATRTGQEADQHFALELLADIRDVFAEQDNPDVVSSKAIIDELVALEDRPWGTFSKGGKPLTAHRLSRLLKGFEIYPSGTVRLGAKTFKGYRFVLFADAFVRYLPIEASHRNNPNESGPETAKTEPSHEGSVTDAKTPIHPDKHCVCADVTVPKPDHGHMEDGDDADDAYYGA
jgi:hypothetical protein